VVTGWVQSLYYSLTIRAGDPRPVPGTPRWAEHRRCIQIVVVALYLLYTIYEADYDLQQAGTFYTDLGIPNNATEREIKIRFRRLAALYHPDKVAHKTPDANAYFVHLKTAADTLTDPAKRFAYDRFGPDIVNWQRCVTIRDFMARGAQALIPYYGMTAICMYGLSLFGFLEWGRYERWLVLASVLTFEAYCITRPNMPFVLEKIINPLVTALSRLVGDATSSPAASIRAPYLPFQAIALARKVSVTMFIAFSQIGPLLTADTSSGRVMVRQNAADEEVLLRQALDRLDAAVRKVDSDASRLLETEMSPFNGDEEVKKYMGAKIKEWLVQNTIRSDPMVRDALGRSFMKRRANVPAGARGTK
jgi:DnaJ-class molecular chaperone with C-terminal Zn finger domain